MSNLFRRVQHVIRFGRQTTPAVESGPVQRLQVKHNDFETREIVSLQQYGFASSPLPGSDNVSVNAAGDNSVGVVIATGDQRYRPRGMAGGEVQMHDNAGNILYFQGGTLVKLVATKDLSVTATGGNITVTATSGTITLQSPTVHVIGDLRVSGDIFDHSDDATRYSMAEMRAFDRNHTHPGVQTGGGHTAVSDYTTPSNGG